MYSPPGSTGRSGILSSSPLPNCSEEESLNWKWGRNPTRNGEAYRMSNLLRANEYAPREIALLVPSEDNATPDFLTLS